MGAALDMQRKLDGSTQDSDNRPGWLHGDVELALILLARLAHLGGEEDRDSRHAQRRGQREGGETGGDGEVADKEGGREERGGEGRL